VTNERKQQSRHSMEKNCIFLNFKKSVLGNQQLLKEKQTQK